MSDVEMGTCDLCGQELLRTSDDCWHPWSVKVACPPEPSGPAAYGQWVLAGNRTGRPGHQHFVRAIELAGEDMGLFGEASA